MENTNKIKRLQISNELFRSWFTEGEHKFSYKVVSDALPADAAIINARVEWDNPNVIDLIIRSESFPAILTSRLDQIPFLKIKLETIKPDQLKQYL